MKAGNRTLASNSKSNSKEINEVDGEIIFDSADVISEGISDE
jgi:hypothetical protein